MTDKEAWELVRKLGHLTHTYEWDGGAWVVREKTTEEKKKTQTLRTKLQQAYDDSLPV